MFPVFFRSDCPRTIVMCPRTARSPSVEPSESKITSAVVEFVTVRRSARWKTWRSLNCPAHAMFDARRRMLTSGAWKTSMFISAAGAWSILYVPSAM